jgi:hypothetical protein
MRKVTRKESLRGLVGELGEVGSGFAMILEYTFGIDTRRYWIMSVYP